MEASVFVVWASDFDEGNLLFVDVDCAGGTAGFWGGFG